VLTYFLGYARPDLVDRLSLIPEKVLAGEVWRLVTYLAVPPPISIIFVLFFWYLFFPDRHVFWGPPCRYPPREAEINRFCSQ
jgi:hypothetical protein